MITLNVQEIQEIIPHRYPFLLVDRVLELEPMKKGVGIKNVTMNEAHFMGHFPNEPIMPGVLLIEAMAQVGGIAMLYPAENRGKIAYFTGIDKVKFRKPVVPGDQLVMEIEMTSFRRNFCKLVGKAYKNNLGGELVCEGEFTAIVVDK